VAVKFRFSESFVIDTDKAPWNVEGLRFCLFGGPGSGKSWTAQLIAEQFLSQGGTVVIFQPRDEYYTLRERFADILCVGGVYAKDLDFVPAAPATYAKAIVESGISTVFYTSDVDDEERLIEFTSKLIGYILKYQELHKRPILLILEECQEYAPKSPSGHTAPAWVYSRMIKAFKDCFLQGRKLNVSTVAISQRPQEVNFTVRQLANLTFYGKFSPQDIGYIERECLKWYRERGVSVDSSRLLELEAGEWLIIHGANAEYIKVTEPRITKHAAVTPKLEYVAPRREEAKRTISQLAEEIQQILEKEKLEESELEKAKRRVSELESRVAELQEKLKVKETLTEIFSGVKVNGELKERIFELEERLKELESENVALRAEVEKNRRVLGQVKALVEGYPIVAPAAQPSPPAHAQPRQEIPEDLKDAVERLDPYTRKIYDFLLNRKGIPYTPYKLAVSLGIGPKSSRFKEALSLLVKLGAIRRERGYVIVR